MAIKIKYAPASVKADQPASAPAQQPTQEAPVVQSSAQEAPTSNPAADSGNAWVGPVTEEQKEAAQGKPQSWPFPPAPSEPKPSESVTSVTESDPAPGAPEAPASAMQGSVVKPDPGTDTVSPLVQAVTDSQAQNLPPWEPPNPSYTILDALEEHWKGKQKGRKLLLINKSTGEAYKVLGYDREARRVHLEGPHGMKLRPAIGEREVPLYRPFWG